MEDFLDFINETHTASLIYKENIDEKINICLGNVSCDMDSTIGPFILAYYLTHQNKYFDDQGNYDNLFLPVVNCPRGELQARLDIAHHFQNFSIDMDKLIYINDLNIDFYSQKNLLNLSIIDHNKLDKGQAKWDKDVITIIDHHVDTKAYDDTKQLTHKVVEFCGSACSMAVNMFFEQNLDSLLDKTISEFFSPAILLDTENLKPSLKGNKWGEIDELACLRLFRKQNNLMFDNLINKKTDRQLNLNLGIELILKKDYKNYVWKDIVAGISVCFNSFHEIINSFTLDSLKHSMNSRIEENHLHLYMIITQTYFNGKAQREFMVYDQNNERFLKLKELFEKHCPFKLKQKKFTGLTHNFAFYIIQDDSVSRKKIEPVFKKIFEEGLLN